jgi:hypothetical protein
MLDTPVTSFSFGLAVALLWYRQWRAAPDERAVHPLLAGVVAALAALSGWQAAVLVAMCVVSLLARRRRGWSRAFVEALPFGVGGAVGLGLSLAWVHWVYGDFHVLGQKYGGRTGGSSHVGLGQMVSFQVPWIAQLLALGCIGLVACFVALRDREIRPLAAMSLASVLVYSVVFRQAAAGHQYWNYWILFPACVGFGYAFARLERDAASAAPALLAGSCLFMGVFNLVFAPHEARDLIDRGHTVVDELATAHVVPGRTAIRYVGQPYRPDAYVEYYTGRTPSVLTSVDELRHLAGQRPDDLVLVLGSCADTGSAHAFCKRAVGDHADGRGRVVTAGQLAAELGLSTDE